MLFAEALNLNPLKWGATEQLNRNFSIYSDQCQL
ncbi:MAG: hypothetical protein ACI9DS_001799 [Glaciecola sp.]